MITITAILLHVGPFAMLARVQCARPFTRKLLTWMVLCVITCTAGVFLMLRGTVSQAAGFAHLLTSPFIVTAGLFAVSEMFLLRRRGLGVIWLWLMGIAANYTAVGYWLTYNQLVILLPYGYWFLGSLFLPLQIDNLAMPVLVWPTIAACGVVIGALITARFAGRQLVLPLKLDARPAAVFSLAAIGLLGAILLIPFGRVVGRHERAADRWVRDGMRTLTADLQSELRTRGIPLKPQWPGTVRNYVLVHGTTARYVTDLGKQPIELDVEPVGGNLVVKIAGRNAAGDGGVWNSGSRPSVGSAPHN
jgi:hypothetical protein